MYLLITHNIVMPQPRLTAYGGNSRNPAKIEGKKPNFKTGSGIKTDRLNPDQANSKTNRSVSAMAGEHTRQFSMTFAGKDAPPISFNCDVGLFQAGDNLAKKKICLP
jgi:hypothetical protein